MESQIARAIRGTTAALVFKQLDRDGDGTVELWELASELRRRGLLKSHPEQAATVGYIRSHSVAFGYTRSHAPPRANWDRRAHDLVAHAACCGWPLRAERLSLHVAR